MRVKFLVVCHLLSDLRQSESNSFAEARTERGMNAIARIRPGGFSETPSQNRRFGS
ncbi:MAG: hypothetical protein KME52_19285 [Desmonostoc geniculatum HA4340-LM1]|nr:hypothetical protein [Desmonostoc geniculatum HA4340-LM1]